MGSMASEDGLDMPECGSESWNSGQSRGLGSSIGDLLATNSGPSRSQKSRQTPKNQPQEPVKDSNSRARARKSHEPSPFLSIDLKSNERNSQLSSELVSDWQVPDTIVISNPGDNSNFVQNIIPQQNTRNKSASTRGPTRATKSAKSKGEGRMSRFSAVSSEWNSLVPRHHKTGGPDLTSCVTNSRVKLPFKHTQASETTKGKRGRPLSPGAALKEQTLQATSVVAKSLARQRPTQEDKKDGSLRKGRLKPLNPVNVDGPSIAHCRGIIAETRSYYGNPNRTLERRRQLLVDHLSGQDFHYERPNPLDSLHQTSETSEASQLQLQEQQLNDQLQDEDDSCRDFDEDRLDMAEYLADGATFITDAVTEDGDINTDTLQHVLAEEKGSSKKGKRSQATTQRPRTVQEQQRKSVRFSEHSATEGDRRTKSANPRLNINGNMVDDIRENIKEESNTSRGSGGSRIGSAGSLRSGNANNNNGNDSVRMSYNTILFMEEDTDITRGRTGGIFRPKSKLGSWEQYLQPDANITTLGISCKAVDQDPPRSLQKFKAIQDNVPELVSHSQHHRNQPDSLKDQAPSRPQSARTAGRTTINYTKVRKQQRPLSAHARTTQPENDLDLVIRPEARSVGLDDLEGLDLPETNSNVAVGHWIERTRDKRIVTGIILAGAPAESEVPNVDKDFNINGQRMNQVLKAAICTQCNKPSNKIVIQTEDEEMMVCEVCDRKNKARIRRIKEIASQHIGKKLNDDDELHLPVGDTENYEEKSEQSWVENSNLSSQKPKSVLKKTEPTQEPIETETKANIFGRMDQLEATLAAIQHEIHVQMDNIKATNKSPVHSEEYPAQNEPTQNNTVEGQGQSDTLSDDHSEDVENVLENTTLVYSTEQTEEVTTNESAGMLSSMLVNSNHDSAQVTKVHYYKVARSPTEMTESEVKDNNGNIATFKMETRSFNGEYGHVKPRPKSNNGMSQEHIWNEENLEVIATTKEVNSRETKEKLAPFAPLCFKVNAKPPQGHFYYFAYGTDMNANRLSTYIQRTPDHRLWGILFGFKLVFNKKGLDKEAGGFPNIQYEAGSSVEGCLYLITPAELQLLDRCIGYPEHFERVMLPVWMLNCKDVDNHGVAQYCVPALVYVARDVWIGEGLDNSYAVDQCLTGGDLLSPAYKEHLAQLRHPHQQ